ncbi:MAG TPA: hypothetical protein VM073_12225 [Usitatibacter sp.]|nr:hypothetical protein [Usitatibacter sp.]
MTPGIEAFRSNRAVVASVILAAAAVTVLCLVQAARMMGWIPHAAPAPQQASATAGIDLLPGETLVEGPAAKPARPDPLMPTYSPPTPPKPAPAEEAPVAEAPPPARVERAAPRPRVAPVPPVYARRDTHPSDAIDDWPRTAVCRACGTVTSITTWPDLWEVRVRFEDGASRTVRFPSLPRFHIGDRVRLENGRLEPQ